MNKIDDVECFMECCFWFFMHTLSLKWYNVILIQGATFPTPNGITEEMARNNCTSFISLSSAGNACQTIAEVDTQGNLENCIDDIRVCHTSTRIFECYSLN